MPLDAYNQALIQNVHPPEWVNPEPAPRYNLVVVGGGTAGLVSAVGAAGLGAKVALVEKHLLGGDCLNVGCVPSKTLIRAGRAYAAVRAAASYGVKVPPGTTVDFTAIMERMRQVRAEISPHDSAQRLRSLGVDVFFGTARFASPDTIQVGEEKLRFRKAVIATGGRAAAPPIPGLAEAGYLTNETVFSLTKLPERLAVIGAGAVGCELGQAFARFGSEVYLIEALPGILPKEDAEAAQVVASTLAVEGIRIICRSKNLKIEKDKGRKRLTLESDGQRHDISVDEILVAAGRAPNVEGLGLERAGVDSGKSGIKVNDRLQTTNPRIYAAGDICSTYKFTHLADSMARIVIQNALFLGRAKVSRLTIPSCTFTDPELAHVGLCEKDAQERGVAIQTFVQKLDEVDRATINGETRGFVKIHVRRGTDQIVGATIVSRDAGEMISEITLAVVGGLGLRALARTIHPYPTQAEAIRKIADSYNRTRLTPFVKRVFTTWLAWTR